MNKSDFTKIIAIIRAAYPNQKFITNELELNYWYMELKDLQYDVLSKAVRRHIQTNTFVPTIAGLRNLYGELLSDDSTTADEAYNILINAIRDYGYNNWEPARARFSPRIKRTIDHMGGWISVCSLPIDKLEKSFINTYNRFRKQDISTNLAIETTKKDEHIDLLAAYAEHNKKLSDI